MTTLLKLLRRLLGRAREMALPSEKVVVYSCGSVEVNELSLPAFKQVVVKPRSVVVIDHMGGKHVLNVRLVKIVCEE